MGPGRSLHPRALVAVLALAWTVPAAAQTGAAAGWQATPASVLKNTLRAVTAAQQRYFAANRTYAPAAERLDLQAAPGVRVEILGATATGWRAKATHRAQPGRSCVIFAGSLEGVESPRTDGDHEMAGEGGVPLCDRMR